jgi:hypothetical protein
MNIMTFLKYLFSKQFRSQYNDSYTAELAGRISNEEKQLESVFSNSINNKK